MAFFDQNVLNFILTWRNDDLNSFFRFITFLANWQSCLFVFLILCLFLLRKRQFFPAVLVGGVLAIGEGFVYAVKHLIVRPRPPEMFRLIIENGFSFPSGHAFISTLLFGIIAFLLLKSCRTFWCKFLTLFFYGLLVGLVMLSRIYFGVHYPSDVLGGMFFGALFFLLFVVLFRFRGRFRFLKDTEFQPDRTLFLVPVALFLFSLLLNSVFIPLSY